MKGGSVAMRRYLNEKALKASGWEIPVAAISGFCTSVLLAACIEVGRGEDLLVTLLAGGMLIALFGMPLFLVARRWLRRRSARRLAEALERSGRAEVPLWELEGLTGVRGAEEKLPRLAAAGFFKDLAVDPQAGVVRMAVPQAAAASPEAREEAHGDVLSQIRALNDAIADEAVSARIDRIEAATAGIFRTMQACPERSDAARRFVNYYLPTTLKLLKTYSLMEEQSYQGKNIQASRRMIEESLERLTRAIEQQQDKLFQSDVLDIESDIRVLETMMASDGVGQALKTGG